MKEKLFKLLFPNSMSYEALHARAKELRKVRDLFAVPDGVESIPYLTGHKKTYTAIVTRKDKEIESLRKLAASLQSRLDKAPKATLADLMRDCLGFPMLTMANVDEEAKPPHYLAGLSEAERKDWISHLEYIFTDAKFQAVYNYTLNLIGNHMVHVVPDELIGNGRLGIVGLKTLLKEFENAHDEFVEVKKANGGNFDPLATMPE